MSSKRYPSRFKSRAGFFASTRDECLSPGVRLECNPEIPVAPGEEAQLLDTSLDEVYWPCSHSRAMPSFPSQLEWKIGLAWANTRGILNSPSCERRRCSPLSDSTFPYVLPASCSLHASLTRPETPMTLPGQRMPASPLHHLSPGTSGVRA